MFDKASKPQNRIDSLIGATTRIEGNVIFSGGLRVDGVPVEYDHERLEGRVGEKVDFRFLERKHFNTGMVMLYRAGRDVHIQYPPDDLSITLNFMISTPDVRLRGQYFFDLERRTLLDHPAELDGSRRVSVLKMAGQVGNGDTQQLLDDLSHRHPCRRTRLAAHEALAQLHPAGAWQVWESACRDAEPLVAQTARKRLLTASE